MGHGGKLKTTCPHAPQELFCVSCQSFVRRPVPGTRTGSPAGARAPMITKHTTHTRACLSSNPPADPSVCGVGAVDGTLVCARSRPFFAQFCSPQRAALGTRSAFGAWGASSTGAALCVLPKLRPPGRAWNTRGLASGRTYSYDHETHHAHAHVSLVESASRS